MLLQAQEFVMSGRIAYDTPLGLLLVLALLVVLATGIVVESGILHGGRALLGGGAAKMQRPVATAAHRG